MMVRLAGLLGCTEGQAYTVLIALTLSLSLAALGLPPTLEPRSSGPLAAPDTPSQGEPAPALAADEQSSTDGVAESEEAPLDLPESTPTDGDGLPQRAHAPEAGPAPTDGDDGTATETPPAPPPAAGLEDLGEGTGFGEAEVFARVEEPGAPHGLAVAPNGAVHVASDNAGGRGRPGPATVTRYDAEGRKDASLQLETDPGQTYGILGLAVDADRLVALVPETAEVLELDLDAGTVDRYATIPDLPPCLLVVGDRACEPGGVDQDPLPRDAVFDGDGSLFVSDAGQGTIWRIPRDGDPEVWHQADDYTFRRPPDGGLGGLAFDQHGDLLTVVTSSFADGALGHGIVHRIAVTSAGDAGSRVELARTAAGDEPVGISVGASGRVYLPLSTVDELLVLESHGDEAERIEASDVAEQAGIPLDSPTDVAFQGETVLVTNKSAVRNDADHWAVLRLQVHESQADPWSAP
jgi:streptogramin lyase